MARDQAREDGTCNETCPALGGPCSVTRPMHVPDDTAWLCARPLIWSMCPREELDAIRAQWLDQDGTSYYGMCSLGHFFGVVVKTIKEYLVKQHPDGSHALSEATAGPQTRIVIIIVIIIVTLIVIIIFYYSHF